MFSKSCLTLHSSLALLGLLGCETGSETVPIVGSRSAAVVQGTVAAIGDFPATVAILDTYNADVVICTGSLLGSRHILTAAHCVANLVNTPARLSAAVGHADASQAPDTAVFAVANIGVHPDWTGFPPNGEVDGLDVTNDVAVLTLSTDVPNPQVAYVLPEARIESDLPLRASLEIVGFGKDDQGMRGVLRRGTAPLRKRTKELLLVGELGSADSCEYDSGGPLYLLAKDGLFLVGITSREWPGATQLDCGEGGVYTMPMAYRTFIEAQVGFALPSPGAVPPTDDPDGISDAGFATNGASDSGTERGDAVDASVVTMPVVTDEGRGGASGCHVGGSGRFASMASLLLLGLFLNRRR